VFIPVLFPLIVPLILVGFNTTTLEDVLCGTRFWVSYCSCLVVRGFLASLRMDAMSSGPIFFGSLILIHPRTGY
jgi:hypothetical protein